MMKFAVEARHENVEVGFQCAQVIEGLLVDFVDDTGIQIGGIHALRANWEDAIDDGDVDVCGVFDDAVFKAGNQ